MRSIALSALLIIVLALALCPPARAADFGTYAVQEYSLPSNATDIGAMAIDGAGNVWLIQDSPPRLYKLVLANGTFSNYTLKGFENAGFAGMSVDDGGAVWFADQKGNRFGAYTESDNHTALFDFPGPMAPSSVICRGNVVWLGCKEEVGELDLRTGEFLDHFVYNMDSYLNDIHFDRMNNVWFVENRMNKVGAYYRMYDKTIEFAIPTNDSYPAGLALDNEGRLWFVESGPNRLGMFHTEIFNFSEYDAPALDGKQAVFSGVAAVNGSVWLTDMRNSRVLKFYPGDHRFAAAQLAEGAAPTFIEADANGSLWVYEAGSKKLAKIEIKEGFGQATPTPAPTTTVQPTTTPPPQPTRTPGFVVLTVLFALLLAACCKKM